MFCLLSVFGSFDERCGLGDKRVAANSYRTAPTLREVQPRGLDSSQLSLKCALERYVQNVDAMLKRNRTNSFEEEDLIPSFCLLHKEMFRRLSESCLPNRKLSREEIASNTRKTLKQIKKNRQQSNTHKNVSPELLHKAQRQQTPKHLRHQTSKTSQFAKRIV